MGVYSFTGVCMCCKKLFSFHPNKIPSLNGEPICKECIDKVNPIRVSKGLPPITYEPDAYKTTLDEEEDRIDWRD